MLPSAHPNVVSANQHDRHSRHWPLHLIEDKREWSCSCSTVAEQRGTLWVHLRLDPVLFTSLCRDEAVNQDPSDVGHYKVGKFLLVEGLPDPLLAFSPSSSRRHLVTP